MAKVLTSKQDEERIRTVLVQLHRLMDTPKSILRMHRADAASDKSPPEQDDRVREGNPPKHFALRLALALSLRETTPPELRAEARDGLEYNLKQVTGEGREGVLDLTPALRAVLSVYHEEDLYADPGSADPERMEKRFVMLLTAHIQRGLEKLAAALDAGTPLLSFLEQALLADPAPELESEGLLARLRSHQVRVTRERQGRTGCGESIDLSLSGPAELPRLRTLLDDLSFELGWLENSAFLLERGTRVTLEHGLPLAQRQSAGLAVLEPYLKRPEAAQQALIGLNAWQEPLQVPFSPVRLVVGVPDAGKTTLLRLLVVQWILAHPEQADVRIFDPHKKSRWRDLKDLKCVVGIHSGDSLSKDVAALTAPAEKLFETPLASLLVVEDADTLFKQHPALGQKITLALSRLQPGQQVLLSTGAANARTLKEKFPQLASPLLLKLPTAEDSQALAGFTGAERLVGEGDILVKGARGWERGRVLQLTWEQTVIQLSGR